MPADIILTDSAGQFGWRYAYWGGAVACFGYLDDVIALDPIREVYGIQTVASVSPGSNLGNRIIFIEFAGSLYIGIEGTARLEQWLAYEASFGYSGEEVGGRSYPQYFLDLAFIALEKIRSHGPTKPMVICGHSLGGAVATIVADMLRRLGYDVRAVWTYGSPRPGNNVFRDLYDIPTFRIVGANDPVTGLPFTGFYVSTVTPNNARRYLRTMSHVGDTVELGDLDLVEAVSSTAGELKEIGIQRASGHLSAHFMGSYMEAMWVRLSPDERGIALPLFDLLRDLDSHGTPNFPLEIRNDQEGQAAIAATFPVQDDKLREHLGVNGKLQVELYTGPAEMPDAPANLDFVRPTFPGYSPAIIPADVQLLRTPDGVSTTDYILLKFELTADLQAPQTVLGAIATVQVDSGGRTLAQVLPFQYAIEMKRRTDTIDVLARLEVAQVN